MLLGALCIRFARPADGDIFFCAVTLYSLTACVGMDTSSTRQQLQSVDFATSNRHHPQKTISGLRLAIARKVDSGRRLFQSAWVSSTSACRLAPPRERLRQPTCESSEKKITVSSQTQHVALQIHSSCHGLVYCRAHTGHGLASNTTHPRTLEVHRCRHTFFHHMQVVIDIQKILRVLLCLLGQKLRAPTRAAAVRVHTHKHLIVASGRSCTSLFPRISVIFMGFDMLHSASMPTPNPMTGFWVPKADPKSGGRFRHQQLVPE
jgi:hypothetical protein